MQRFGGIIQPGSAADISGVHSRSLTPTEAFRLGIRAFWRLRNEVWAAPKETASQKARSDEISFRHARSVLAGWKSELTGSARKFMVVLDLLVFDRTFARKSAYSELLTSMVAHPRENAPGERFSLTTDRP